MRYSETKIGEIINEEFDLRLDQAVLTYIIDKGWSNVQEITDEEISEVKGNAMMTDRFIQSMIRAARRICKECDLFTDFLPYVKKYSVADNCTTREVTLYQEDYSDEDWSMLLNDLYVDYENGEIPAAVQGYFIEEGE